MLWITIYSYKIKQCTCCTSRSSKLKSCLKSEIAVGHNETNRILCTCDGWRVDKVKDWCWYASSTSRDVVVLVRVFSVSLHVITIDETLDALLQICRLQNENKYVLPLFQLQYEQDGMNRVGTLTGNLSWLYNSAMSMLWLRVFRIFMMRTMAASTWYCRSWKTRSVVDCCSSCCREKHEKIRY